MDPPDGGSRAAFPRPDACDSTLDVMVPDGYAGCWMVRASRGLCEHGPVGLFGLPRPAHLLPARRPHHPQVVLGLVRLAVAALGCHALLGGQRPVYLLLEGHQTRPV